MVDISENVACSDLLTIFSITKRNQKNKYKEEIELLKTCTSILRPSTTVPCNFSLALSASALFSKVTNPNPCMQREKGGKHAHRYILKY